MLTIERTHGIFGSIFAMGMHRIDCLGASKTVFCILSSLQYYNYMGMLAVEGTYDKLEALLATGIHPVDILLMMAAQEGDKPKIQELLQAGATCDVKNADGKTALDLAADDDIRAMISAGAQKSMA